MKTKRFFWVLIALLIVGSLFLAACGGQTPDEEPVVEEKKFLACQVTDVGGIDDKSFNASAWLGVENAIAEFGIEGKFLESQQQTDYEANINAFLEEGCDIIIPVGFLLADATVAAAEANPDVPFAIVDVNWVAADNIYGSGFAMNEGTFLTGYLAAGMTETGVVGTYGGMNIPPVTVFMDGYALGAAYYNEVHGTDVKVLGWDPAVQEGLFTGNFESTDDGRTLTESELDEGADIFMPVGGQIGAGSLAVLEDIGSGYVIGVDRDWTIDYASQADYILASAYKGIDMFVFDQIKAVMDGTFTAGNLAGDIANGHVDIIYGHAAEDKIPAELKAEIEELKTGIVAGEITTLPVVGEEAPTLGSEASPIKVLFVPSVDVDFMIASGELIEQGIFDATGLYVEVSVPTSYAATIEEMCASPTDTIGFIPAMGYALANQLCGVEPALASVRYGWNVYWTMFIVARDSDFQTLADLEGASWGIPSYTSTSGYLFPSAMLAALGITPGELTETGGHSGSVKAIYNGEVDFATAYFSAPLLPEGSWTRETAPDVPEELLAECGVNDEGKMYCGEYRVLDARTTITEEAPDVIQKVRILALSDDIPNDTMSFSPEFPADLKEVIITAITAYVGSDACAETLCNEQFYDWTGVSPIFDENFDGIRNLMEAQGITLENIGE
jgi:basic membrane protein A